MNGWWLAWISVLILVPGVAATFAVFGPGRVSLPTRLALVFGLGYAVMAFVGFVLTLLHVMRPIPFFATQAAVTAALLLWATVRRSWRDQIQALTREIREEKWALATGGVVLVWIAVIRIGFLS